MIWSPEEQRLFINNHRHNNVSSTAMDTTMADIDGDYLIGGGGFNSSTAILTDVVVEESNQFVMTFWSKVFWNSLFLPMVAVATGGNLIVIWIVWSHKRMRTVTNIFLVNLAVADCMVSTLNVTFNFAYMLTSDWAFGTIYCKISQFVAVLSICASVFTLTAIAIDR